MFPMSPKIMPHGRLISGTGGGFHAAFSACDPDLGAVPMQLPDLTMCGADHAATLDSRAIRGL
jgi:hypothetical protein